MNRDDFANAIKQKYPEYSTKTNDELVNAVIQKNKVADMMKTVYPQYSSLDDATITTKVMPQISGKSTTVTAPSTEQKPEDKGFFSNVVEDIKKRGSNIMEDINKPAEKNVLKNAEAGLNVAGEVAGGIGDIIGNVIHSGLQTADKATGGVVSKAITNFIQTNPIAQSGIELAKQGKQAYDGWKAKNPQLAKDVESVINISSLFPVGKGAKVVEEITASGAKKIATTTGEKLIETAAKTTEKDITKAITPETTKVAGEKASKKAILENLKAGTLEKGPIKGVVTQTPKKLENVKKVVSGVIKGKDPVKDLQAISNKVSEINKSVKKYVAKTPGIFNTKTISKELESSKADKSKIFGTSDKDYNDIIDTAIKHINSNDKTLSGLLKARKEFDAEIKSTLGEKFFGDAGTARKSAISDVRQKINNYIADNLPKGNTFKKDLRNQHLMLNAQDTIATNLSKSGINKNIIERAQSAIKKVPFGNTLATVGSIEVVSHLPEIGHILTSPAGLGALLAYGTYKVGKKIITSAQVQKGLGEFLLKAGNKITVTERKSINKIIDSLSVGVLGAEGAKQSNK